MTRDSLVLQFSTAGRLSFLAVAIAACTFAAPTASVEPTVTRAVSAATPTSTPTPRSTATRTPRPNFTTTPAPTPTVPTDTVIERGTLPPGFSLTVYGDVPGPTSLAFGPDGQLYVASTNQVVYAFADRDGDRRAEERTVFARGVPIPLGLLWVDDRLYISYNDKGDGRVAYVRGEGEALTPVLTGLPSAGRHQNDGMALGADGFIYLGMGSSCDACREPDARSASILRFKPNGSQFTVFATGLRNPYDVAFNAAGHLFATDNGRDDLGEAAPFEELNHIVEGGDYGYPNCWFGNIEPECAQKRGPAATFEARSSANGLTFYDGENFPPQYREDAFVAVLGSYVYPALRRGVQRVPLTTSGDTYTGVTEWFLILEEGEGRPLDVTVGPDGGLYVADYEMGQVYRIVYGAP